MTSEFIARIKELSFQNYKYNEVMKEMLEQIEKDILKIDESQSIYSVRWFSLSEKLKSYREALE